MPRNYYWLLPSIFGATFPSESLLNFNEEIPVGLYSSSSGSTDSLITKVAAYRQTKPINSKSCIQAKKEYTSRYLQGNLKQKKEKGLCLSIAWCILNSTQLHTTFHRTIKKKEE